KVSLVRRLFEGSDDRASERYSHDWFLSQQNKIYSGRMQDTERERRPRAQYYRGIAGVTRSRSQDRECCARQRVWNRERRGGRHSRIATIAAARPHEKQAGRKDRAGSYRACSEERLDRFLTPVDLSRTTRLQGSQTAMRNLRR